MGESPQTDAQGLAARRAAADAIDAVLANGRPLEEAMERLTRGLEDRDRALARMIASTVLRRLGTLRALVRSLLEKPLPASAARVDTLLFVGAAQIALMDVPDHAAVDTTVALAGEAPATAGFKGLVNAVLRRLVREGTKGLDALDPYLDVPEWLRDGWSAAYGGALAREIAMASRVEAPLDITAKADPALWAEKLGGRLLPTGSIRLTEAGNVTALPGFTEGAWWVQDAAAAIPARLIGAAPGMRIADLCAAPGGKTAQLAASGAEVTAVDRSGPRLKRLKQNLARLGLEAAIVEADATQWRPMRQYEQFDAVLLDAPCSATGTIRRHPDVAWTKRPADIASLVSLQARLIDRAADLVKPGGLLVYSTCSLELEEGERQVERLLANRPDYRIESIGPGEDGIAAEWLTPAGFLRTLPVHLPDPDPRQSGLDGFFAARLRKA